MPFHPIVHEHAKCPSAVTLQAAEREKQVTYLSPCSVAQACRQRTVIPACFVSAKAMIQLTVGAVEVWHTVTFVARQRSIGAEASAMVLARTEYVTGRSGDVADSAHAGVIEAGVGNELCRRVL